jgi:hypothetical protein
MLGIFVVLNTGIPKMDGSEVRGVRWMVLASVRERD